MSFGELGEPRRRVRVAHALALGALLGCAGGKGAAASAPHPPTCSAPGESPFAPTPGAPRERAKAAFANGTVCFREARYDLAAHYFALADEASPHPSTTFNLALAYDHAGALSKAVEAYEQFLETAPAADPQVEFARERVKFLRKGLPHGCTAAERLGGLGCPPPASPPY